jgi:hypothetical protein
LEYAFEEIKYDIESIEKYALFFNILSKQNIPKLNKSLSWEYTGNPLGNAFGFDAIYETNIVAHYSAQPIICIIDGELKKGLLALHVATHPEHQRKGLFKIINNLTHEKASSEGYEFVIGVANAKSAPRYQKSLNFQIVCNLDARIGFGLPKLTQNKDSEYSFKRVWDENTLKWRLKNPVRTYGFLMKDDDIYTLADTNKFGFKAVITSFSKDYSPNINAADIKQKIHSPVLWLGINNEIKWNYSLNLPLFLRPSPLFLIYYNLKNQINKLNKEKVLFNNIDFDAF